MWKYQSFVSAGTGEQREDQTESGVGQRISGGGPGTRRVPRDTPVPLGQTVDHVVRATLKFITYNLLCDLRTFTSHKSIERNVTSNANQLPLAYPLVIIRSWVNQRLLWGSWPTSPHPPRLQKFWKLQNESIWHACFFKLYWDRNRGKKKPG